MDPVTLALGLAKFAPSLLRYFGAGEQPIAVAEQAIELAKTVTGKENGPSALAAIEADPALAQAYHLAVLQADTDLEQAYLADRKDARARDVEMRRAGYANHRADWMVVADVVGLVACLVVLSLYRQAIPNEVVVLLTTVATLFGVCLRDAHQFEFGSSRGSKEKDALLSQTSTNR